MRLFKKGFEAGEVQKWVLGLIMLFVLVFVVYTIAKGSSPAENFKGAVDCRLSVEALSKEQASMFSIMQGTSNVKFNCQTNYYENITLKETAPEKQKEELTGILVSYMRDCWYEFGEGRLDPFSASFGDIKHFGFVCSRFIIPEGFSGEITESDIKTYLASHNDPLTKKNYVKFFEGAFPENSPLLSGISANTFLFVYFGRDYTPIQSISRSNGPDFAVVLYGVQPTAEMKALSNFNEFFTEGKPVYNVFIVPYNKTKELDITELKKKARTD